MVYHVILCIREGIIMTLINFKTDLEAVKYIIEQSGESSWALEKVTGISRQTIDRWIKADHLKIRRAALSSFAKQLNYQIQYNKDGISVSPHTKKLTEDTKMSIETYEYCIALQKKEIIRLEDIIKQFKREEKHSKPAYHFKLISTYKADTDEWLHTDIFGDFSMTGFTYEEIVPLMNEENDDDSWIDRYHPDSRKRLTTQTLKDIKTDYHYLKWDHMMWRAKDGQYKCYNIDLLYRRAEEKVTSMFYWVNGDAE